MRDNTVRLILGISKERGVEAAYFHDGWVDSKKFIIFLKMIEKREGDWPIIFADNASWHTSNETTTAARELELKIIFNLVNRPDRNPIELLFGYLKEEFRKRRLLNITKNILVKNR